MSHILSYLSLRICQNVLEFREQTSYFHPEPAYTPLESICFIHCHILFINQVNYGY